MTAGDWREKAEGAAENFVIDLPLPSGMVVKARRPGPARFARWNRLPMMMGRIQEEEAAAIGEEEALELMGYMREVLVWCVVEPRIAVDGGAQTMRPRDVPDLDLFFILNWAMRVEEAEELRPFRGERADGDGDGGGKVVEMPAVRADGDGGPDAGADVRPGGDEKSLRDAGGSGGGDHKPGGLEVMPMGHNTGRHQPFEYTPDPPAPGPRPLAPGE